MADVVPEPFVRRVLDTLTPWDCGSELVRLGPEGDGGYLVPDAHLDQVELVMSAGLGSSSGFEDAMFGRFGTAASIVDGSPRTSPCIWPCTWPRSSFDICSPSVVPAVPGTE